MKEYDNRKIHTSSNFLLSICLLIMLDTLLLRPSLHCSTSLHFTTLHPTTLHYTYRHFTSSHLHFTTLSFGLTHLHFLPFTAGQTFRPFLGSAVCCFSWSEDARDVRLATHMYPASRLRMHGAISFLHLPC
jgi:hypothetical protein